MKYEDYKKQKKTIYFCTGLISSFLIGIVLGIYPAFISVPISKTISIILIIVGYVLFHVLAHKLKKYEIHGLHKIALGAICIYTYSQCILGFGHSNIALEIFYFCLICIYVFLLVEGSIIFCMSLWHVSKGKREDSLLRLESIVAIVTAIISVIISFATINSNF